MAARGRAGLAWARWTTAPRRAVPDGAVGTEKAVQINIDRSPLAAVTRCRGRQAGSNPPSPFASARRADHARIRTFSANPDSQQCKRVSSKRCCVRGRRGRISRRAWRSWRRASPPALAVQTRACTQAGNATARQRPPPGLHGLAHKESSKRGNRNIVNSSGCGWILATPCTGGRTLYQYLIGRPGSCSLNRRRCQRREQPTQLAIDMDGHASPCRSAVRT